MLKWEVDKINYNGVDYNETFERHMDILKQNEHMNTCYKNIKDYLYLVEFGFQYDHDELTKLLASL